MYHLACTSSGTPIALTQGMDNILQPPTRKLISSLFSHEVNWGGGGFHQNSCLILEKLDPLLQQTVFILHSGSSSRLLRTTSPCFPLNFTVIYQVGLKGHHAVPRQLHAIVLSILASKVSCVVVLPHPGAMKK